jgi:hypothetical protein
MDREHHLSFGVFKPVGHVVISFPAAAKADAAAAALAAAGFGDADVRRYTDREMLEQIAHDIERASPVAEVGQEMNLIRAQRELAKKGYHWLIVRAPDDARAVRVAGITHRHGAERAQRYGSFIIEELIERPGHETQVAESPDRGLDAQTPSGEEGEAGEMLAREGGEPRPPGPR